MVKAQARRCPDGIVIDIRVWLSVHSLPPLTATADVMRGKGEDGRKSWRVGVAAMVLTRPYYFQL